MLYTIFRTGDMFIRIIDYAILIYCILSWFQPRFQAFYWLQQFIQPFLAPFRGISMKIARSFNAPVDLSALLALISLQIILRLWWVLYRVLALRMF